MRVQTPRYRNTWNVIAKRADETIASDSTLSDDSELSFIMAVDTTYRIRLTIFYNTSSTADFKYAINAPSTVLGTVIRRVHIIPGNSAFTNFIPSTTAVTSTSINGTSSDPGYITMDLIYTPEDHGTFAFQWAQNTSDASNTTVLKGSTLEYMII